MMIVHYAVTGFDSLEPVDLPLLPGPKLLGHRTTLVHLCGFLTKIFRLEVMTRPL